MNRQEKGDTAMQKLVKATRPGIVARLQMGGIDTEKSLIIALNGVAPLNGKLPGNKRLGLDQIGVDVASRESLVKAVAGQTAEDALANMLREPPKCGHVQVLFSTREDVNLCCSVCDLKIEKPS